MPGSGNNSVAILVPCYNSASYLPALVESINLQTIPFDEVIFYDDCSTDETIKIASKLGINIIKGMENLGASFARNRLINQCKSTWIHFHDSDDLIHPEFVAKVKNTITCLPDKTNTCILSDMLVQHSNGTYVIKYDQNQINQDPLEYFLVNDGYAIIGCYPKTLLNQINGFCENLRGNEDPDLHIRLAMRGAKFKCLEETLVINMVRSNSFSALNWKRCMTDRLTCITNYSVLPEANYRKIIAKQAAELSNYFYRENDIDLSEKARNLAEVMGKVIIDSSFFSHIVSRWLGVQFYLWTYRFRVDLKIIKR